MALKGQEEPLGAKAEWPRRVALCRSTEIGGLVSMPVSPRRRSLKSRSLLSAVSDVLKTP
jgi:hypothetical protein